LSAELITLDLAYDFNSNLILDSKTIALLGKDIRSSLLKFKSQYTRYKFIETNVTELITKLRENHQKHIAVFSEIGVGSDIKMQPFNKFESSYIGWLRDRENQNISVEIKWKIEQSLFVLRELDEVNQEVLSALSSK
jgi:hypothetical protein